MLIHMFVLRWNHAATAQHKVRAATEIRAFAGRIPGLVEVHFGENLAPGEYGAGGVMKFTDADALAAYQTHPIHRALLEWLVPLVDAIEVDFAAEP